MGKVSITWMVGVVGLALGAQAADQNLTVSQGAATATNFNTIAAAWDVARVETGDHTITIQDNGPGGTGYTEAAMVYTNIPANVATSITITADPGIAPTITTGGTGRIVRIRKSGLAFSMLGVSDTDRISLVSTNNNPAISIDSAVDSTVIVRNVNITNDVANDAVGLALTSSSSGPMEVTNVSFFGGSPTSTEEVLKTGYQDGGTFVTNLTNVDFSGADGLAARIRLDGAGTINVVDSTISAVANAPAFFYQDTASSPSPGSNITFRDCAFSSGTSNLFQTIGESTQTSPNMIRLYRPTFLGSCGTTMFNIDDSNAEVYVLGLDDADAPTVPRVDLDPIGTGTTTRIASLRSGKISLQYVEASVGTRNLVTSGGILTANPTFEMIGCEWLNGTGLMSEGSSTGGFAPRINYSNTLFTSGLAFPTFIQAAGFPRGATNATIDLTHVTMTGQSFAFIQTEAIDVITASACIFDGTSSVTGVAPTRTLVDGGIPNVTYCPGCSTVGQNDAGGWASVPSSTIIANPMLETVIPTGSTGRLTAASTAALGLAVGSTEMLDVDLEARPQPAGTDNDIGADEASFSPTDITPDTLSANDGDPIGTVIGTLTVTDPDLGESFTWFLDDDASGRFGLTNASGTTVDVETLLDIDAADGPQSIDVRVRDSENNEHDETITITLVDTTPPITTVTDPSTVTVECGTVWSDPGAIATDNVDGAISVVVGGDTVDTSAPNLGTTFTITYDAQDAAGNDAAQVTRDVTVVDTTPPTINLTGGASITINCGDGYTEPGVSATDGCEGSVPVTTGGDTITASSPPGVYSVTYDAQDSTGNMATQVIRSVTVANNCPLTVSPVGATTIGKLVDEDHTFEVSISGAIGGTTLQWFFEDGSKALTPIVGATSTTLNLTELAVEDSGTYVCQATDDVTVAQSPDFTLTVSVGMTALGPLGIVALIGMLALAGAGSRRKK